MKNAGANTYNEINSQTVVWEQSLERISKVDFGSFPRGQDFNQIIFTGCGSTYYLSLWAARATQLRTGWVCLAVPSSELFLCPEAWLVPSRKNLIVAISRSGSTTETIKALKMCNQRGCDASIVVTCYPDSELAGLSNAVVALPHAQEESIAQTRSFTSMMLGVSHITSNSYPETLPQRLSEQLSFIVQRDRDTASTYGKDDKISRFFFLGSGSRYGLACEAMLKMKEMSLSYAEAYHFLEFRHGPMSMVNENSLVIGLMSPELNPLEFNVLQDMKGLGSQVMAIGPVEFEKNFKELDHFIPIDFDDFAMLGEVLYLPILQLLAFERALANGHDPDNPHNLTSVVVLEA
jgi:glucosamine--fructose-6-phosphate aminotransferase (isomerizing)